MDAELAYILASAIGVNLIAIFFATKSIKEIVKQRKALKIKQRQFDQTRSIDNQADFNVLCDQVKKSSNRVKIVLNGINTNNKIIPLCNVSLDQLNYFHELGMTNAIVGPKIKLNQGLEAKLNQTWIQDSIVKVQKCYDTPKHTSWAILSSIFTDESSLGSAKLFIKPSLTGITVYGTLAYEDSRYVVDTHFIGQSINALKRYFKVRLRENSWGIVIRVSIITFSLFFVYKLVKWIRDISEKQRESKSFFQRQFIEADPTHRLTCLTCKQRPSDCVTDCGHLCLCQECTKSCTNCPMCDHPTGQFVKIFIS